MSRTAQLPPRFPQHRAMSSDIPRSYAHRIDVLQKHEFTSHDPPLEDQSWWVDDLVGSCWGGGSKMMLSPLRRSVSDPSAILEESLELGSDSSTIDDRIPELVGSIDKLLELTDKSEGHSKLEPLSLHVLTSVTQIEKDPDSTIPSILNSQIIKNHFSKHDLNSHALTTAEGLDPLYGMNSPEQMEMGSDSAIGLCLPRQMEKSSSSVYGPNSPRKMEKLTHQESSMVSSIFETASKNAFDYATHDRSRHPDANISGSRNHVSVASETCEYEKISQRHAGQRSRIRKVQYIAELEKTVNFYQLLGADLAVRVAMLYQQQVALSMENHTLKQKIASLNRNKLIKEGQHHFLKNELKKLKATSGRCRKLESSLA